MLSTCQKWILKEQRSTTKAIQPELDVFLTRPFPGLDLQGDDMNQERGWKCRMEGLSAGNSKWNKTEASTSSSSNALAATSPKRQPVSHLACKSTHVLAFLHLQQQSNQSYMWSSEAFPPQYVNLPILVWHRHRRSRLSQHRRHNA